VTAGGFVLAGGRSSRMGRDKALIGLAGRPLIVHALDVLGKAGLPAKIAGARSNLSAFAPVIADGVADAGPLAGICAALADSDVELAVFLSVDLPLIPASLIQYLLWDAAMTGRMVTLASVNGFPQTFPAVVRREALAALERELRNGKAGCLAGFQAAATGAGEPVRVIAAESLAQTGQVEHPLGLHPARWFQNLNSEVELERVRELLERRIA
jgi:molybdopterin-guanine dinucleotide biosynthesis protein A